MTLHPCVVDSHSPSQLAQDLFYANGTVYDQTRILVNFVVDKDLLAAEGLPFYAGTWVVQLLTSNLGLVCLSLPSLF